MKTKGTRRAEDRRLMRRRENLKVLKNPENVPEKEISLGRVARRDCRDGRIK